MKINVLDFSPEVEVDENFKGLCVDCEGDIWLFGQHYGIVVSNKTSSQFVSDSKEEAISNVGPFTVFNGLITLEND